MQNVVRRSKGYQDIEGSSSPGTLNKSTTLPDPDSHATDEIEMASVTVVPDDTFTVTQAVNALGFGWFQVKLSLWTGLCWMADSMEMTILSILSPALHCYWRITRYQEALTTTVVFLGMMLSSTFWGNLSDRYGRKYALTLCAILLFYYGLLSALAPSFMWILLLRGLVGFAIGCTPQSVTLYAEFLPTKQRAKCVVLLDCFWALGACFEVVLALVVMPTLGWKWLLALSTGPLLIFMLICPWLPESARFHIASGQTDKALATIEKIASDNGKPMLLGRLVVDDTQAQLPHRGRFKDLLIPSLRMTSLLLWFIWMACAFCYYGLVLMSTELFEPSSNACIEKIDSRPPINEENCAANCKQLQTTDYIDLLWTTLAEFPGIFVTIFIIERFGRKRTMAVQFVVYAVCCLFLLICPQRRSALTLVLFFARGIIAGVFQAAYVYTPEVYPTSLRSVGVGSCSAMARFGAMVTPYVAQVLLKTSVIFSVALYATGALLAALACILLPLETTGKELTDNIDQQTSQPTKD
ncbi:synaptic vesicle 2-related protein [Agrilus planipennis]|uniref:Synaptic vesicle 2-related protein n=1 Tax=Agrilus planipennis TaxID=224129 RepID=A0A1W4WYI2_AGRPL|nr:synaptic vesicle 2-related protein [Agrilus planipennis]XP_018328934.1 synaptic vesicle 2-related protein [Agrilus planipennis]XP_018328935.1 synaptic vesicle 2-related protein [Agrilus planipennis]XP_018328936.1 synaptic vesicle 2-related protein [Agrilus planipennis]